MNDLKEGSPQDLVVKGLVPMQSMQALEWRLDAVAADGVAVELAYRRVARAKPCVGGSKLPSIHATMQGLAGAWGEGLNNSCSVQGLGAPNLLPHIGHRIR